MRSTNSQKQPAKKPAAIDLEAELARIAAMYIYELRKLWREREGREAPKGFSKAFLPAHSLTPSRKNSSGGSVAVRQYAGARHEVFVVEGGFSWQGWTLSKPLGHRQGDHGHPLERLALLRPHGGSG